MTDKIIDFFINVFFAMLVTLILSDSWRENLLSTAQYTVAMYVCNYFLRRIRRGEN